tara:strand:+ start:576 stop:992 length:417 start_codon:yes stop_codon:yes gene_type:complete
MYEFKNSNPKSEIYFNLHKGIFSVRKRGGKVWYHTDSIIADKPTFVVQPAGWSRTQEEQVKNVHAFVRPQSLEVDAKIWFREDPEHDEPDFYRLERVRYNPYHANTFVDEYDEPIHHAEVAYLYLDKQNKPVIKVFRY